MKSATIEQVRADGFRTQRAMRREEGSPGPQRLNDRTGTMEEVSAENELARRRNEAHTNVGVRRPADATTDSYETNVARLQTAEAVLGHLLGHMPDPGTASPADAGAAAKNLGRIITVCDEAGIRLGGDSTTSLADIVAAKNEKNPAAAATALSAWAGTSDVRAWAQERGMSLASGTDQMASFLAWSQDRALNLVGQLRIRTETAAVGSDAPMGSGGAPAATGMGQTVTAPVDGHTATP